MLDRVRLLQSIGRFDQVSAANIELTPLTLVYAENARGKTTLVSIFRSLQRGDPLPIQERKRLGSSTATKIALTFSDEADAIVFENGSWNRAKPNIAVFDEQFINDNVYSGLVVQSPQREGLHGLIVGAQGVSLLRSLQAEVEAVEAHNTRLRILERAVPATALRGLTIEQFCALPDVEDVDARIEESRKAVSAAQQQESITRIKDLTELSAPQIDSYAIEALLQEELPELSADAEEQVSEHLAKLGPDGEAWVAQGQRLHEQHAESLKDDCPFCAQSLSTSTLAKVYAHHFSAAYDELKSKIQRTLARVNELLGETTLERVRLTHEENSTKSLFWQEFAEFEPLGLDVEKILVAARAARDQLSAQLTSKASAPLDRIQLSAGSKDSLLAMVAALPQLEAYNASVRAINEEAARVREAINVASLTGLREDLNRLEATKRRKETDMSAKCAAYLTEKGAKKTTENRRAAAKQALDAHLQNAFPAFQDTINLYLRRLNAGFRIDGIRSLNTRKGPSCVYSVVVDGIAAHPVPVNDETTGSPSFKTVLSTSDRSTLALAAFFSSLPQDQARADTIVLIDDPINSLDEHRQFATVQEIRRLAAEVKQVIVLSHSRPLVCHLWESPGQIGRTAIEVSRAGDGSTIRRWDVSQHGITEHDKRHAKLRQFLDSQSDNPREVAEALRPTIESFLRVAYPEHCRPGTLLGPFRNICSQHVGAPTEILSAADTEELRVLTEYANRFHHDTNPAWQTADINDAELLTMVRRTVGFTKRA